MFMMNLNCHLTGQSGENYKFMVNTLDSPQLRHGVLLALLSALAAFHREMAKGKALPELRSRSNVYCVNIA